EHCAMRLACVTGGLVEHSTPAPFPCHPMLRNGAQPDHDLRHDENLCRRHGVSPYCESGCNGRSALVEVCERSTCARAVGCALGSCLRRSTGVRWWPYCGTVSR